MSVILLLYLRRNAVVFFLFIVTSFNGTLQHRANDVLMQSASRVKFSLREQVFVRRQSAQYSGNVCQQCIIETNRGKSHRFSTVQWISTLRPD